jgi:hypothetical protein
MKVIYVDIDETICNTPQPRDYSKAVPIKENIEKINKLYDEGHTIVYWTARGSKTQINWYDLTKKQLIEWGAKHNELNVTKPFYDMFIDDKTKRIEEI